MIIVNVTNFLMFVYKLIYIFLNPNTRVKIKLFHKHNPKKLFKYID